jgi:hypothetical protein
MVTVFFRVESVIMTSLDYYDSSTAKQLSPHSTEATTEPDDDIIGWWPDSAPWFRVALIMLYGAVFIGCIVGRLIKSLIISNG